MATKKVTDIDVISAMADGEPVAVYRKAKGFLGRILVSVFNSITNEINSIHLEGNPNDPECESCYVELWSQKELQYFERANKYHINNESIVRQDKKAKVKVKKALTDEQLQELVSKPFMALKAAVEKMTTEAAILRVIAFAEEAERPEKTMEYLRTRLSLIQSGELDQE